MLKLYNTLSRKKEVFRPRTLRQAQGKKKVEIFVCGPTVYDFSHIGHARTYVVFDMLVKYLRQKGYDVFYLQNITDVDDKIILQAKKEKIFWQDLSLKFEREYLKDMRALNINSVSKYARATSHIKEIIKQVKRLLEKGFAYQIKDGVYYDISKFKNYGKLSGRSVERAEDAVSRIDEAKNKKNKGDFCLWKFSKKGEPKWPSPWGLGRPGWHIEDTAITEKYFGPQYDIHGGARDLIFPHHEAEIAQMESISGKSPMVKYWMHIGFLTINGQKMAKSLGNFITIKDFFKIYPPQYLRFLILKTLWRSPIDYSEKAILETKAGLEKIEEFLGKLKKIKTGKSKTKNILEKVKKDFYQQLDDDFNTPNAIAVLFEFIRNMNRLIDKNLISKKQAQETVNFFKKINQIFEIIDFKKIKEPEIPKKIKKLVNERERYRQEKNWKKADEIRKEIEKSGYKIEDTEQGPKIKKI